MSIKCGLIHRNQSPLFLCRKSMWTITDTVDKLQLDCSLVGPDLLMVSSIQQMLLTSWNVAQFGHARDQSDNHRRHAASLSCELTWLRCRLWLLVVWLSPLSLLQWSTLCQDCGSHPHNKSSISDLNSDVSCSLEHSDDSLALISVLTVYPVNHVSAWSCENVPGDVLHCRASLSLNGWFFAHVLPGASICRSPVYPLFILLSQIVLCSSYRHVCNLIC